jgi:uncharacterized membrane protein
MLTVLTYIVTLVVFLVLDAGWISMVALPMFKTTFGADMMTFRPIPGVLFYLLQIVGIMVFVYPLGRPGGWTTLLLYGALFGLFTYATFDLTNYATLKPYTLQLAAADIVWGTCLTAVTAALGAYLSAKLAALFGLG